MQEWQRLTWATTNQVMGHLLKGCADVALAGTPQQALAALHKTHTDLFRHSVDTFAEATRLWRKQNAKVFATRATLTTNEPNDERKDRGDDHARHDRKEENAVLGFDAIVSRQAPKTEAGKPRPH
jgi:hypothetical protein